MFFSSIHDIMIDKKIDAIQNKEKRTKEKGVFYEIIFYTR